MMFCDVMVHVLIRILCLALLFFLHPLDASKKDLIPAKQKESIVELHAHTDTHTGTQIFTHIEAECIDRDGEMLDMQILKNSVEVRHYKGLKIKFPLSREF
jgi:hypothetical protein